MRLRQISVPILWVWGQLWKLPVAVVGGIFVLGVGIAAMYSNASIAAALCYFIGVVWLTVAIIRHEEVKNHERNKGVATVIVIIASALFGGSLYWDKYVYLRNHLPSVQVAPVVESAPQISLKYQPSGLPIRIKAGEAIMLYEVRPDNSVHGQTVRNNLGIPISWPTDKTVIPPETTGMLTIKTDHTIFNFSMEVIFNGSGTQTFKLPDLRQDKAQVLYFINQSQSEVFITFPDSVTFEIEGVQRRQAVAVSVDGFMSQLMPSMEQLFPSRHSWDGDKIIDPDQRQKQ